MRAARRLTIGATVCVLLAVLGGCSDSSAPDPPEPSGESQDIERHDEAVEGALAAMRAAALRGDRGAVTRHQQELERLADTDPQAGARSSAADPFERMLDVFEFKRAPLFVQQMTSSPDSHRVYLGVDHPTYCLLAPDARRAVVEEVYSPADRALRASGISDLEFVVVPVTGRATRLEQALAIGRRGVVRLTQRGRAC